jgi:hypothetical protein
MNISALITKAIPLERAAPAPRHFGVSKILSHTKTFSSSSRPSTFLLLDSHSRHSVGTPSLHAHSRYSPLPYHLLAFVLFHHTPRMTLICSPRTRSPYYNILQLWPLLCILHALTFLVHCFLHIWACYYPTIPVLYLGEQPLYLYVPCLYIACCSPEIGRRCNHDDVRWPWRLPSTPVTI